VVGQRYGHHRRNFRSIRPDGESGRPRHQRLCQRHKRTGHRSGRPNQQSSWGGWSIRKPGWRKEPSSSRKRGNYAQVFTVDASGNGDFAGNLNITGKLAKSSGSFKIDHPLDPANKYLSHSFVESPDLMNVYNGNITTDRHGLATVNLPDYFVAKKISAKRFVIRTNKPNVEVSWQITGIRHDAYANVYRIPVEEDKAAGEQGYYLHPEVFGQPESKSISAASKAPCSSPDVVADASHK
jgi:hypothetical protein